MQPPTVIVTGASGLVGRSLLNELKDRYRVFAIARRSQRECGAPTHPNIAWMRVDVGDREGLERAFREITTAGGARFLVHLAAYYDFTGEENPEYRRTNIEGTRNVLDLAEELRLERFVFASSVAACSFPRPEGPVSESTPPDGDHLYAWSKREGERLVLERSSRLPVCIARLGAVYSDWCEYPPLYIFLNSWTSRNWRSRILAGRGDTAIPYVHLHDVSAFLRLLLARHAILDPGEILISSTLGSTSHRELFRQATLHFFGQVRTPVFLPARLCGLGMRAMSSLGRLVGDPPFERPWMRRYIDRQLVVDNTRTCSRLGWMPSARYRIDRRLRFLIEALKSEPVEWNARNMLTMRKVTYHPDLRIYQALMQVEDLVIDELVAELGSGAGVGASPPMRAMGPSEFAWFARLIYRLVMNSVQSGNRMLVLSYFEVTGRSRFESGFHASDLRLLLTRIGESILARLGGMDEVRPFTQALYDRVIVPLEFGKDEVEEQYERFVRGALLGQEKGEAAEETLDRSSRELLEDTIWRMLALRKG